MTDYSDWEEWMDEALFDALIVLRKKDWLVSAADRVALEEAIARVNSTWAQRERYVPAPERP
jgi:hypothetical protein